MRLPPESAVLLRAATALVPKERREEWRREWHAELWWWLSSTPDPSRHALAGHCVGAVTDAFWLRMGEGLSIREWLERPAARLAVPALLLLLMAILSGGFRHTRRALFERAPDGLVVLTQTGPFMGQIMPLPARGNWLNSGAVQGIVLVNRSKALGWLTSGLTAIQAQRQLRLKNGFLNVTSYAAELGYPIAVLGPAFLFLVLLALLDWLYSRLPAYCLAHPLAWVVVLFVAAVELPASPAALLLPYLVASFIALRYCRRDRGQRCPVCLRRLGMPVRIGLGPRSPFEPTGTELLCPRGHGALFTTEESEPESRWSELVA